LSSSARGKTDGNPNLRRIDMSTDEMKGKTKEAAGVLTDDDDLQREGRNDQRAGEAKDKLHDAEDWVEDKIDDARDRLDRNDK
jgi:uncharacterized protein YjbJ (UPF0337 family)